MNTNMLATPATLSDAALLRIVSLDSSGQLSAFVGQTAGTTVHLIIDVNGYLE